jgi:predicted aminopeptidase
VPGLQRLLRDSGGSLPEFYTRVEATRGMAVQERRAALCQ